MKIKITNVAGGNLKQEYGEVLNKYNLTCEIDEYNVEIYFINIDTLEQLFNMVRDLELAIVINDDCGEIYLTIHDDYMY